MRGPRDLAGPFSAAAALGRRIGEMDEAVGGAGLAESGRACGGANGFDGSRALRRRPDLASGNAARYSLTIVRLVWTPCCESSSAMASHEAPFVRSARISSSHGTKFWKRGRRRG